MNVAVCDDERDFRLITQKHLKNYFDEKGISVNFFEFSCGEDLIDSQERFDLIFIDVEMGKVNGIDAGKELKAKNPHCIVIVITAHDGYLDDAFKINAFRYLQKPLNVVRLYKALDDAEELMKNDVIAFYDTNSLSNVRIYANDVICVEIEKKKTKIITVDGTYYSNEKISAWRDKLNSSVFVCPHSSYIVNLDYSIKHTRTMLVLAKKDKNGNVIDRYEVSIAPKKQAEIRKKFFYVMERR